MEGGGGGAIGNCIPWACASCYQISEHIINVSVSPLLLLVVVVAAVVVEIYITEKERER